MLWIGESLFFLFSFIYYLIISSIIVGPISLVVLLVVLVVIRNKGGLRGNDKWEIGASAGIILGVLLAAFFIVVCFACYKASDLLAQFQ